MKTITIEGIEYNLVPVIRQLDRWSPEKVPVDSHYSYMSSDGEILRVTEKETVIDNLRLQLGNYFHTKEEALEAVTQMRKLLRLRAYVREFAPEYKPDWGDPREQKWFIYFDTRDQVWSCSNNQFMYNVVVTYLPLKIAQELVLKLNSREVVL